MPTPPPDPGRAAEQAELQIKERERRRDHQVYQEQTSRIPRSVSRFIPLLVVLLIILGLIVAYHLLQ